MQTTSYFLADFEKRVDANCFAVSRSFIGNHFPLTNVLSSDFVIHGRDGP
jgi:hypothetical protein